MTGSLTDRRVSRALLGEANVRPSKRLGQSFLADGGVVADIEEALARLAPETIIEIGPGLGAHPIRPGSMNVGPRDRRRRRSPALEATPK